MDFALKHIWPKMSPCHSPCSKINYLVVHTMVESQASTFHCRMKWVEHHQSKFLDIAKNVQLQQPLNVVRRCTANTSCCLEVQVHVWLHKTDNNCWVYLESSLDAQKVVSRNKRVTDEDRRVECRMAATSCAKAPCIHTPSEMNDFVLEVLHRKAASPQSPVVLFKNKKSWREGGDW